MKVELLSYNNMRKSLGDLIKVAPITLLSLLVGCINDKEYNKHVSIHDDEKPSIHQELGYSAFDNVYITYNRYDDSFTKNITYQVNHSLVFKKNEFKDWLNQVYKIDILIGDHSTPVYLSSEESRIYYSENSYANLYYFCYEYCRIDFDMNKLQHDIDTNEIPYLRMHYKSGKTSIMQSAKSLKGKKTLFFAENTISLMDKFTHSISNGYIYINPPKQIKYPFELAFHIKDSENTREASFLIESPDDERLSYKIEEGKWVDYKVILTTENDIEVMGYFLTTKKNNH